MKIVIFRLTEADNTWYVWPCLTAQLYSFDSRQVAEHFAGQLAEANPGGMPVHMECSIEQAAALI
jgi:hypothetical protein